MLILSSSSFLALTYDCCGTSLRCVGESTRRTARQCDAEVTPGPIRDYSNLTAVGFNKLAGNCEPKSRALDAGIGFGAAAEEQIEDRLTLLCRHAGTRVHDFDHRLAGERA